MSAEHAPENDRSDSDGQTLREVLLNRLQWEYGDDGPWQELGSLTRLERDVRRWFKETAMTEIDYPEVTDDMLFGAAAGWTLAHDEACSLGAVCSRHQPIDAPAQKPRLVAALIERLPTTPPGASS